MDILRKIHREIAKYRSELRCGDNPSHPINIDYFEFNRITMTHEKEDRWRFEASGGNGGYSACVTGYTNDVANKIILCHAEFVNCKFGHNASGTDFILEHTENAHIVFNNCRFRNKLKIRNTEDREYSDQQENKAKIEVLEFRDCTMEHIDGETYPYLRIGYLDVEKFLLKNLRIPHDAEVNIGDCQFNEFWVTNIRNLGKFRIYKINSLDKPGTKNKFQLDNTSLGDSEFQSVNLASFRTHKIYDNILSDLHYTNLRWEIGEGKDIEVDEYDKDKETKMAKIRDTYRSLKNVAAHNDDLPKAYNFYAKEMKYHEKLLRIKYGRFNQEKTILLFGRWTNKFGESWLRPIGWILGLAVLFYSLLLISLGLCLCTWDYWDEIPIFLNPTHQFKFIQADDWGFWAYAIDFIFRIFQASLIYQAIQAFRRFSRKL